MGTVGIPVSTRQTKECSTSGEQCPDVVLQLGASLLQNYTRRFLDVFSKDMFCLF